MDKLYEVCYNCGDKHCCHGLCRELNDYLVAKENKSGKLDSKKNAIK